MEDFHKDDCWNSYFIEDGKTRVEDLAKDVSKIKSDQLCESEEFKTFYHIFLDYMEHIKIKVGQLAQVWLSFIEMVEILLNTIYATPAGNWFLLFECYRDMMPYTFAYDHLNYAKYSTPMLAELTELEENYPELYTESIAGNFSAQITSKNTFSRIEMDKVIEVTINKDTKCSSGLKGFSTNISQVNLWALNATHRAEMQRCFQEHLHVKSSTDIHLVLRKRRIEKNSQGVTALVDILKGSFIHPFAEDMPLVFISSGLEATERFSRDLHQAKTLGQEALKEFFNERILTTTVNFYEPVKKL